MASISISSACIPAVAIAVIMDELRQQRLGYEGTADYLNVVDKEASHHRRGYVVLVGIPLRPGLGRHASETVSYPRLFAPPGFACGGATSSTDPERAPKPMPSAGGWE